MEQNLAFEVGAETEAAPLGLGVKGNWKVTVGQQFNENWNNCKDTTTSSEEELSQGTTITVPSGTKTELRVYQYKGDTTFSYDAKLAAGGANEAQTLVTPVPRALGMSGARTHPCIGYVVVVALQQAC